MVDLFLPGTVADTESGIVGAYLILCQLTLLYFCGSIGGLASMIVHTVGDRLSTTVKRQFCSCLSKRNHFGSTSHGSTKSATNSSATRIDVGDIMWDYVGGKKARHRDTARLVFGANDWLLYELNSSRIQPLDNHVHSLVMCVLRCLDV